MKMNWYEIRERMSVAEGDAWDEVDVVETNGIAQITIRTFPSFEEAEAEAKRLNAER